MQELEVVLWVALEGAHLQEHLFGNLWIKTSQENNVKQHSFHGNGFLPNKC